MNSLSFTLKANFKVIFLTTIMLSLVSISAYYFLIPQYEIYEVQTQDPQAVQFFHQFNRFEDFKVMGENQEKVTWAFDLQGKLTVVFYFAQKTAHEEKIKLILGDLSQKFTSPVFVGQLPHFITITILLFLISFLISNLVILTFANKEKS